VDPSADPALDSADTAKPARPIFEGPGNYFGSYYADLQGQFRFSKPEVELLEGEHIARRK
jgi:hypothetical protein